MSPVSPLSGTAPVPFRDAVSPARSAAGGEGDPRGRDRAGDSRDRAGQACGPARRAVPAAPAAGWSDAVYVQAASSAFRAQVIAQMLPEPAPRRGGYSLELEILPERDVTA